MGLLVAPFFYRKTDGNARSQSRQAQPQDRTRDQTADPRRQVTPQPSGGRLQSPMLSFPRKRESSISI